MFHFEFIASVGRSHGVSPNRDIFRRYYEETPFETMQADTEWQCAEIEREEARERAAGGGGAAAVEESGGGGAAAILDHNEYGEYIKTKYGKDAEWCIDLTQTRARLDTDPSYFQPRPKRTEESFQQMLNGDEQLKATGYTIVDELKAVTMKKLPRGTETVDVIVFEFTYNVEGLAD